MAASVSPRYEVLQHGWRKRPYAVIWWSGPAAWEYVSFHATVESAKAKAKRLAEED